MKTRYGKKLWNVWLPEGCDLGERIRRLADRERVQIWELVERMVTRYTSVRPEQLPLLPLAAPEPTPPTPAGQSPVPPATATTTEVEELRATVSDLAAEVAALRAHVAALTPTAPEPTQPAAAPVTPEPSPTPTQPAGVEPTPATPEPPTPTPAPVTPPTPPRRRRGDGELQKLIKSEAAEIAAALGRKERWSTIHAALAARHPELTFGEQSLRVTYGDLRRRGEL